MNVSSGVGILLGIACILTLLASFFRRARAENFGIRLSGLLARLKHPAAIIGAVGLLAFYTAASLLHWEAATGAGYFLLGLAGYGLFSCLLPDVGGVLLLGLVLLAGAAGADEALLKIMAPSLLFGMAVGVTLRSDSRPADFLLSAVWLIGDYWGRLAGPESRISDPQNLLAAVLSISLLLRSLQLLPAFPEAGSRRLLRLIAVVACAGLAAWLVLENLLLKGVPAGYPWLFAGGTLLSFLLAERSVPETEGETREASGQPLASLVMRFLWIGLAALAASRLFGAMGWIVLTAGMLANARIGCTANLAALFLLSRALLACFMHQYNPNVTGINLMHPYVGAALYAGFAAMLLLSTRKASVLTRHALLPAGLALLAAAAANYFLHAEAAAGLLVAVNVAGLGVALLSPSALKTAVLSAFTNEAPPFLALMLTNGALLSHELLDLGSQADKPQKLMVLGALAFLALVAWGILLYSGKGRDLPAGTPVNLS